MIRGKNHLNFFGVFDVSFWRVFSSKSLTADWYKHNKCENSSIAATLYVLLSFSTENVLRGLLPFWLEKFWKQRWKTWNWFCFLRDYSIGIFFIQTHSIHLSRQPLHIRWLHGNWAVFLSSNEQIKQTTLSNFSPSNSKSKPTVPGESP